MCIRDSFLLAGGMLSIMIFFATTVPSRSGVFFTDRKRYQRLAFPGKAQDVELAMLRIMGSYQQCDSYRNVALSDIEELTTADDPGIRFLGHFNLICRQVEMGGRIDSQVQADYVAAGKHVSAALVKAYDVELESTNASFTV